MKWILLTEEKIPNDIEMINASFNKDASCEKYTPTKEFAKSVYDRLNKELFFEFLISSNELKFEVRKLKTGEYGKVLCKKDMHKSDIIPLKIILNEKYKLSIHSWIEVMLHEMIHICDYLCNPNNFYRVDYNAHGEWFMKKTKEFRKYGFNVLPYGEIDSEIDGDDDNFTLKTPNLFVFLGKDMDDLIEVIRVSLENKNKCIDEIKKEFPRKRNVLMMKTYNPNSNDIDEWKPGMDIIPLYLSKKEIDYYGPFVKQNDSADTIQLINENKIGICDNIDEYIEIVKTIKGVIDVRKIDDDTCEFAIS